MRKSLKRTRLPAFSPKSSSVKRLFGRLSALAATAGLLAAGSPETASATEAAFGRYIPGLYAGPGINIVPPAPGFYWATTTAFYSGTASRNLSLPFGGELQANIKGTYFTEALSSVWVPDISLGQGVTIGFGATVPWGHLGVKAGTNGIQTRDTDDNLGDMVFFPLMVGYQNEGHFLSFSLNVTAPTGHYKRGALANVGLNYWTFTPTIAYMHYDAETKWQYSTVVGIDINTTNQATDYTSGALFHLDATLVKNFDNGFGVGVFGSILYQIEDDKGALAQRLNGFKGRSFAIGPMLKYSHGKGLDAINISLNWAPEFGVKNRMKGNAVYLNASGRF